MRTISLATCAVVVLLLGAGCGSASNKPSAADIAAKARASRAAAARAHQSAVYSECQSTMKAFEAKVVNLDSRLDVGVQFAAYTRYVGGARVAYTDLISKIKTDGLSHACITKVGEPLQYAMNDDVRALNVWNNCIQADYCTFGKGTPELKKAQSWWAKSSKDVRKAQAGMASLAPR